MQRWATWMARSTAVGAVGTCVAGVLWGPRNLVVLLVMVSLVTTFIVVVVADDQRALLRRATWSRIVRTAVCATTVLASIGLVAALAPALGLLVAAAWAATSPPVWGRTSTRPWREEPTVSDGAAHLSDEDLCRAWFRTTIDLSLTSEPQRRLALVIIRQHLLDEVWSRDRQALEKWVACGARAERGPARHYFDPS